MIGLIEAVKTNDIYTLYRNFRNFFYNKNLLNEIKLQGDSQFYKDFLVKLILISQNHTSPDCIKKSIIKFVVKTLEVYPTLANQNLLDKILPFTQKGDKNTRFYARKAIEKILEIKH